MANKMILFVFWVFSMKKVISTDKQLGQILRGQRKSQKLTQHQLAPLTGISQERLSSLELNPSGLTLERLLRWTSLLGLELVIQDRGTPLDGPAGEKVEW
jgi:HTH-type transcriptional regulator / antitoxin HipB